MKAVLISYLLMLVFACSPAPKIQLSQCKPLRPGFSGSFSDTPYLTKKTGYLLPNKGMGLRLLGHFEGLGKRPEADSVQLTISSSAVLTISFTDSNQLKSFNYTGRFSKKGFFEIIFKKKSVQIPPLIPVFYSHRDINRIRLYLTKENNLLIARKWILDGNVFLFSGGESDKTTDYFKGLEKL